MKKIERKPSRDNVDSEVDSDPLESPWSLHFDWIRLWSSEVGFFKVWSSEADSFRLVPSYVDFFRSLLLQSLVFSFWSIKFFSLRFSLDVHSQNQYLNSIWNFSLWSCTHKYLRKTNTLNTLLSLKPKGYGINQFYANNLLLFDDDKHKYIRTIVVNLVNQLTSRSEVCKLPLSITINRVRFVSSPKSYPG